MKRSLRTKILYFKEALVLFFAQFILCCIVSINYRSISQANYLFIGTSAATSAVLSYVLIKQISKKSRRPILALTAFTLGTVVGDMFGTFLSKWMMGS